MKERFEQLRQEVIKLVGALKDVKSENQTMQQSLREELKTNQKLEEKLSYQEKLVEALQVESKRLNSERAAVITKTEKIEDILAIIEQAQAK